MADGLDLCFKYRLIFSMVFLPPEEYYKSLPRKRCGTGVIFLNSAGELLLLKPTYKPYWQLAGGVIDANEAPLACAIREIKEEIGLDSNNLKLLSVDYVSEHKPKSESFQFTFFGGTLTDEQISQIRLQADEISEYKFMNVDEALKMIGGSFAARFSENEASLKDGLIRYLEDGILK